MKFFDFHTHVYPPALAERATRATCDFYSLDTDFVGTAEALLARGRAAGVTGYLLLPVAVHPHGVRRVNEYIVEQTAAHPEFYGFGTIHHDMEHVLDELDHIRAVGLRGLKLHPDMQEINTDDERLYPVYERLCELQLPLMIHCGDKTRDFSHPRRLRRVLDRFPSLTVVAAHLGGWSKFDEALDCLGETGCLVDISSCMPFLPPDEIVRYVRGYGAHRVLFGTDFPMQDPVAERERLLSLDLTDEEKERIAYQNAEKLLGIGEKS